MSYYIHPDVKTLEEIADNWWKDPGLSSLSTSSLAVQDPYSEAVTKFVKWYRKGQTMDLQSMDNSQLENELWKFLADVDDMFFFSLLSRKVEKPSGLGRLVRVRVMDGLPEDSWCGAYKREEDSPYIRIWRSRRGCEPQSFEHLVYTLVHEMCHAYLDLFNDKRHRKHQEWVYDFKGHGEMFWVLLRFISRKIGMYTNSTNWRKELDGGEAECYSVTKTSGVPGSWGTPERTLMGGILGP
ncbi:hypothetical protein ANO14919_133400 [Xylariales sp. No.14919]|nr:hypothetical protein ANO14919_133400 [Xylariales sp. No.14919]